MLRSFWSLLMDARSWRSESPDASRVSTDVLTDPLGVSGVASPSAASTSRLTSFMSLVRLGRYRPLRCKITIASSTDRLRSCSRASTASGSVRIPQAPNRCRGHA